MAAPTTLKEFCTLLVRSKLMTPDEVKNVVRHQQSSGKDPEDLDTFRKLLYSNKYLTEYQLALLTRGHSDGFFLDQYKILELIAKGSMAGVYKAVHQSGQTVAIKVLPGSKAKDPDALARFRREARLITKLDHPNIVRAFQLGTSGNKHYLAMEYLDGDTLEDILGERKRLPPMEAMRIAHQVLLGLQNLYEKGMIHRDINPTNIMLLDSGTGRKDPDTLDRPVKILDIGVGKSVFDESIKEDPTQLTSDGVLLGSPEYLAPEQARKASAADIRSDIYSVGCVLFHMLTGQPPFPDKSILNQVMRHATEPPRPLADLISPVPDGLQNVMNWMLAKDPAQRYSTPEKAAQALQLLIRNIPANIPAPKPLPEYLKWLQESGSTEAAALPSNAVSSAPSPLPVPVAKTSAPAAGIAVGRLETGKRSENPKKAVPAAVPAGLVPTSLSISGDDYDVELVDVAPAPTPLLPVVTPMPPHEADEPRGLFELDRRDAIMLGFGGGMVLGAILGGYGLSRLLRRAPIEANPPTDPEPNQE
ncbi:serine/threonine protein kinase [Zavarzinella formosa]|uniref:serine/threonine protein kinase n=1 Tax=Zavarzinella formosa TaxID=360055 RepID=UPI0002EBA7AA|nr:serine/threonine-protein kinase [Zavarzinella formosa]